MIFLSKRCGYRNHVSNRRASSTEALDEFQGPHRNGRERYGGGIGVQAEDGALLSLRAEHCAVRLEQVSRGHYWTGLSRDDASTCHTDFTTRGYLKCVLTERLQRDANR